MEPYHGAERGSIDFAPCRARPGHEKPARFYDGSPQMGLAGPSAGHNLADLRDAAAPVDGDRRGVDARQCVEAGVGLRQSEALREMDQPDEMRRDLGDPFRLVARKMSLAGAAHERHGPLPARDREARRGEAGQAPFEIELVILRQPPALVVAGEIMLDDDALARVEQGKTAVGAIVIEMPAAGEIFAEQRLVVARGWQVLDGPRRIDRIGIAPVRVDRVEQRMHGVDGAGEPRQRVLPELRREDGVVTGVERQRDFVRPKIFRHRDKPYLENIIG